MMEQPDQRLDAQQPPGDDARSLLGQLAFRPSRPHLLIGLLFLVLGLLVTVAIVRPGTEEPWRTARTEDLVQILDDLGARQDRLEAESARLTELQRDLERDDPHWYGPGRSFEITVGSEHVPVTADRIVAADLSGWSYLARRGTVAVDPELGRISFPPSETPDDGVWVGYRYGFPDDVGGGEYARSVTQPTGAVVIAVGGPDDGPEAPAATIAEALDRWQERRPLHTVIEIRESGYYIDRIAVQRQGVRNEAVVAGITHGRIEEPVHEHRPRRLVDFVFDRLAAQRNLDHHVDVLRRVLAGGDF